MEDMEEKGLMMAAGRTLNGPETDDDKANELPENEYRHNTNSNKNQFA